MDTTLSDSDKRSFRERVVGRSIKEDTFHTYWRWIQRFEAWYDSGGHPTLRDLEDFDTMLVSESTTSYLWTNDVGRKAPDSYSYQSRNQAISGVKMWVRRHYDHNIPEQPQDIVRGTPKSFDPTYLTREQVNEIIEEADGACNCPACTAALALSYDAVLRASEMGVLTVSDVDFDNGEVDVTAMKGSRDSTLTISDNTLQLLKEYMDKSDHNSGALFRNTYGDQWNPGSWATHVGRHHVDAGSHSWGRHTPIMHMFQAGAEFGEVYRRARHVSSSTTARYARFVGVDTPDWAEG